MSEVRVPETLAVSTALVAATFFASLFGGELISAPSMLGGLDTLTLFGSVLGLFIVGSALSHIGFRVRNVAAQAIGIVLTFIAFFLLINTAIGIGVVEAETAQLMAALAVAYFVVVVAYGYQQRKSRFANWEIPATVAVVLTAGLGVASRQLPILEPMAFIIGVLAIMAHIFFVTSQTRRVQQGIIANSARLYTALIALPIDIAVHIFLLVRKVRE